MAQDTRYCCKPVGHFELDEFKMISYVHNLVERTTMGFDTFRWPREDAATSRVLP